jgi:hypothetical protein
MLYGLRGSDEISGLSVIYDEVAVMAPADLYLVERNGWPVRTPEAYPVALRFELGRQPQPPSGQDLEYIDSCLGPAQKREPLPASWTVPVDRV